MRSKFCPWLAYALGELGESEIVGDKDNPRIVEYHKATLLKASKDFVPWCGSFVSWCLQQAGLKSKKSARAKDYLDYGTVLREPIIGCIAVFSRDGGGHVGFYWGKTANGKISILGGNQKDSVCISQYGEENLLGYRWPEE